MLRTRLIESSALKEAAAEACVSLYEGMDGTLLSQQEAYAALGKERVVSAALQVQMDATAERHRQQIAVERSAALRLVEDRSRALKAHYASQLEAAQRRCRSFGQRVHQQRSAMLALQSLNAQLLNQADPLLLDTSKINWPRPPALQPPALQEPPKLTALSRMASARPGSAPTPAMAANSVVAGRIRPTPAVPLATAQVVALAASAPPTPKGSDKASPRPRSAATEALVRPSGHAKPRRNGLGCRHGDTLETVIMRRWGAVDAPPSSLHR